MMVGTTAIRPKDVNNLSKLLENAAEAEKRGDNAFATKLHNLAARNALEMAYTQTRNAEKCLERVGPEDMNIGDRDAILNELRQRLGFLRQARSGPKPGEFSGDEEPTL